MSDNQASDTGIQPEGASLTPDSSTPQDATPPSGDTDEFVPEYDAEGQPQPVPYDRFKESRGQLRETKGQVDALQYELQLQRDLAQQQQQQLQHYNQMLQAQQHAAPSPQQPPQGYEPYPVDDPYADPQDLRIKALERQLTGMKQAQAQQQQQWQQQSRQFEDYRSQQSQKALEREISGNIDAALGKYPTANKFWIYDQLMRGQSHDARNIATLAKRSHEEAVEGMRQWAAQNNYKAPARPLMSSNAPAAVPQDFGDNLDLAEAAAIERLRSIS